MSIPISPAQLKDVLARFGSASLITKADPHVKILTVDVLVESGAVIVEEIRESTRANIAADPHVTLIWQTRTRHGWTLIVDGIARLDGDRLRITMESGMLHRPRSHSDGPAWENSSN